MKTNLPLPSKEELWEYFDYNPETGVFSRIKRTWSRCAMGPIRIDPNCPRVGHRGKAYYIARLIWKMMTDEEPEEVDHRDLNVMNTKFDNLRAATSSQNKMNRRPGPRCKSGVRGVGWIDGKLGRT